LAHTLLKEKRTRKVGQGATYIKVQEGTSMGGWLLRGSSLLSSKGIGDQQRKLLRLERKAGLLGESSDVGSKK